MIIFYVVTKLLKKFSPKEHESLDALRATAALYTWPEIGDYCFEVVGESHYQRALLKHAGDHDEDGADKECVALLIKAVRVAVGVDIVGHLSRDDARSFRRRLGTKKLTGQITSCYAIMRGGFTRKSSELWRLARSEEVFLMSNE